MGNGQPLERKILAAMSKHLVCWGGRGQAREPGGYVAVPRRVIRYGRRTVDRPLDEIDKENRLLGIYHGEYLEQARSIDRFAAAVEQACGRPFDVWPVLNRCQPHDPETAEPCALRGLIRCDASDLQAVFYGLVLSGLSLGQDQENALAACLRHALTEIFGDGPDLLHADLTDDAAVREEDLRSLAACFWTGEGLVLSYLLHVTLCEVVYAKEELYEKCCQAASGGDGWRGPEDA
jgi:hypothetical protein